MGLTFFVATAGLVVAGYLGYRKLQKIEDEIREEVDARDTPKEETGGGGGTPAAAEPADRPEASRESSGQSLEALLLDQISRQPGMLQTALYEAFADHDRKQLQSMLLKLDREGRVRREKKGSTYQLYPA
ncbi:MAG: hypothetical protein GWN87_05560 [Desulfuromonadales bacterium]|nr:hypothetical protein [Desulfuromonadales bacterium]NIS40060.1 hypothetical protein [Desulfuromonadales bacterium]